MKKREAKTEEVVSESRKKRYFLTCLPYINFSDQISEFDFGFAKIWNFDLLKEKYIPQEKLRNQVERILNNYTTKFGPVRGIGVATINDNLNELTSDELQQIDDARLILFISALSKTNTVTRNSNTGHSMISSENFEKVQFSAMPDTDTMTEYLGFVVPSWHGGIKIDENNILRPRHILTPFRFEFDEEMVDSLIKLKTKKPKIFRKIISSVQVFFESYYNTHQISHNARILLQASAFEILLQTKSGGGREALIYFIKHHANYPEDEILAYKSERRGRFVEENGTIKELWADRFFSLRNHIIHGYRPKNVEFNFRAWQRHFDIATYFYIFTLKREIEKSLRKEIFNDDIAWTSWVDDLSVPPRKFTGFTYDSYGRRALERLLRKAHKKTPQNTP